METGRPKRRRPPNAGKQGRRRGTPNKATADVRKIFAAFVAHNAEGAQILYDRVARKNPAKALSILARVAEFVLPKLARTEVTLPPATLTILNGEPIRDAETATRAYLEIMGNPSIDLTAITFEVPAQEPLEAEPPANPEPAQPARRALEAEALPDYQPAAPGLELVAAPDNVIAISEWERLGK